MELALGGGPPPLADGVEDRTPSIKPCCTPTPIPPHLTGQDTNSQHMPDAPSDPRFLHAEQSVCHGQSLTLCTLYGVR